MVGKDVNSDCAMSKLNPSPDCFTLERGTSRSLSPTPSMPPVETTTWAISPDAPSRMKSWIFPISLASEPLTFLPFSSSTEEFSASSLARLTSLPLIADAEDF
jgi:hypothetical protein